MKVCIDLSNFTRSATTAAVDLSALTTWATGVIPDFGTTSVAQSTGNLTGAVAVGMTNFAGTRAIVAVFGYFSIFAIGAGIFTIST